MSGNPVLLLLGPLACVFGWFLLTSNGHPSAAGWTAGITLWCALWWIAEVVPIPVTAMLPLALFPALDVLSPAQVGEAYGSPTVLLVLGGFVLSQAMLKCGVHARMALAMVRAFGANSSRMLLYGFMAASALLSMWLSNAATVLVILPVALAVLEKSRDPLLSAQLLLGIAYACSIGSLGTPIGTPANLVFIQVYADTTGHTIGFFEWMRWGIPAMLLLLPLAALWLGRNLDYKGAVDLPVAQRWNLDEKRVFIIFLLTACAWMFRTHPFGGWSALLQVPGANDASVALIAVIAMFLIPDGKGSKLLDWESALKIPWGMLILLASGFSIAAAFSVSGLGAILGQSLQGITTLPLFGMILFICLMISFFTEFTSNTATTALMMPVLAAAALATGIDPILLMLPAALASSCCFILPIGTVPNTVIFSTGTLTIRQMAKEGVVLNFVGVFVISIVCYWLLR
jgi:solute carrier family 13 (sodium-dependent dicarboxylate transporter), member 2/3/5